MGAGVIIMEPGTVAIDTSKSLRGGGGEWDGPGGRRKQHKSCVCL